MKILFTILLAILSGCKILAKERDAIFVWVNGDSCCYKFDSIPTVSFKDKTAVLTQNGNKTPVLTIDLDNTNDLKIMFGIYQETNCINTIQNSSIVSQNGKYIKGGKLIIIKNGRKYDSKGVLINEISNR